MAAPQIQMAAKKSLHEPQPSVQKTPPPSHQSMNKDCENSTEFNEQYTTFSRGHVRGIMVLVTLAGFFSPLSAMIYFPALEYLGKDLNVTLELMNLTITAYIIVQGFVPSVLGDMADQIGRRPVYLMVLFIYSVSNIGLALQDTYAALLCLRMLQSAGSSGLRHLKGKGFSQADAVIPGTIALGFSVVSDLAPPHKRGKILSASLLGPNTGPSLGPVLGGILAEKASWRWIFWFLTILGLTCLCTFGLAFPETARSVVGNGSVPAAGTNRTLYSLLRGQVKQPGSEPPRKPRLQHVPNPIKCLRVAAYKDTALILVGNAIFYTNYSCVQASLAPILMRTYSLNALDVGLCYLAYGIACGLATYLSGKVIDYDYKKTASLINFTVDEVRGDDLTKFPIEAARLRSVFYFIFITVTSTAGYGWAVQSYTHLSVPLIMQFLCGLSTTGTFNICATLILDLHPSNPGIASASISILRCSVAAVGISVLQPLLDAIGTGWTFTIFASLCTLTAPMLWMERKWGAKWRHERKMAEGD